MNIHGRFGFLPMLGLAVLASAACSAPAADDDLAWPPLTAQTRPWAWWWWHGSAVDETNIAHELGRFHDAGLGGVQIIPIYGTQGAEARDIAYLSPRWLQLMGGTVDEARRLGLGVDMALGSGWCFGGPTVSEPDANASVVVKTWDVAAGGKITSPIKREGTQTLMAFSAAGQRVDLTGKIAADGGVDWTAPATPAGGWTVYAISQKPSGQKVKRPGPGGEGWMLNPAYPRAVRDWLPWFDRAFAGYTGAKPAAVFQDSYEYRTDWSPEFLAQFEKRRGYRLQAELPALFADETRDASHAAASTNRGQIARVKYDYRRTLAELMAEESEPAWIGWAHTNGFATIYQAHGTPGNWLDLYGDADVPETEMFHNDRSILISKFASSAAHTQGRPLVGAETGTWLQEHFTETLADLKFLADDMFLAGVNHIYYHGACYSPDDAAWPGWLFYASTEMNPRNPIWHDVPALNEYIARCQAILQGGQPDNDVLLYWPAADFWSDPDGRVQAMSVSRTEWFKDQPIGKTARELWEHGYAFDYVSDAQLQQAEPAPNGEIKMPGGRYGVIVVPQCQYMPLETFRQLLALAEKGATVIFDRQLPADVPGLANLPQQRKELAQLRSQLKFQKPAWGVSFLGQGRVRVTVNSLVEEIPAPRLLVNGDSLNVVRRARANQAGWDYFIVNRGPTNFDGWVSACQAKTFILMNPLDGNIGLAATQARPDGQPPRVHLQLAAGESVILRALADKTVAGPEWTYWRATGGPVEITGPWQVKFIAGGPVLPADFQTAKLASWTTFPDTNAAAFAGTAKYAITFDAPPGIAAAAALNLGGVCQSARVRLNGRNYGTLIAPPFRVWADNLKPAANVLEVEVTSVAANRIRDLDRRGVKWKVFKDINLVDINYHPFNAADWPLAEAGLLGPVTLAPAASK